ncbi:MAG TPA: phenylalanine--tRNA ligase subunit beta [Mycobacteriales bacterium]|nr:phenylalanine--tRNA ligase subunit beta [Mycobacteriales bacterium]
MRVPLSWLREYADVTAPVREIAAALVRAGFEVEQVEQVGTDIRGVVTAEVLQIEELTGFKKPIRHVRVGTGDAERQVVCGAANFSVGDRVAVALPGGELPGGFAITARETYGRVSDGMICSARELGVADDHTGILVLGDVPLGADVVDLLHLRDEVLDIAVTPDRGYGFSVRGIAREAATAFGVPFTDPGVAAVPVGGPGGPAVAVDDPAGCSRYVARVVTEVDATAASPVWLQRRITLAGMRAISLVVDVTNYVMLGLGQPLHAFDQSTVQGRIVVRRARPGERLRTLDDVDRALDAEDLLITDDSGPIAIAGVMGGQSTEVTAGTRQVLIEAAHFDPVSVGRTSRRHGLVSEASKRFERGVDPDLAPVAAEHAVRLLADLAGGTPAEPGTDVDARPRRESIRLVLAAPGRRAGRDYDEATVRRRLTEVGCHVAGADPLEVTPPSWRPDLTEAVDLTEEVIRLEGYDTVPSELPAAPAGRGLTVTQRARRWVGTALANAGYVEVTPYPFMDPTALDSLGVPADDPRRRTARIANPVSDAEPVLRTTLLPGLLTVLLRNVGRGLPDVGVFEIGPVFVDRAGEPTAPRVGVAHRPSEDELAELDRALPVEREQLGVVLAGAHERAGWWGPGRPVAWVDAIEAARTAARSTHTRLTVRRGSVPPWHPGRCAELVVDGAVVGHAGELHPRVVDAMGLPPGCCAVELDLHPLWASAATVVRTGPLSTFPPAAVDVALVVADDVPASEVEAALRAGAGPTLESIRLFDLYTGDRVPAGSKSVAFSLRFRAPDTTLTDEQVNGLRDSAVAAAAERTGAVLRG